MAILQQRTSRRLRGMLIVGLGVAVSALAACTGDDRAETTADTATPGGDPAAPATQPAAGSTAAAAAQTFTVRVSDQGIEVSPTTARPGAATFQVTNNSASPQEIEIDGPGEDGKIDELPPNETRNVVMTLQAGAYEIKSEDEGRRDQTRRTRLTVQN